jgi:hypothetical protein
MVGDFYDWHIYQQFPHKLIITGEEHSIVDILYILSQNGSLIERFFKTIEVFTDEEIYEFGYKPLSYNLRKNNIEHLITFVEEWWTVANRKIFFSNRKIRTESPYFSDEADSFYRRLPYSLKHNKKLKKAIAKKRLPEFISNRPKRTHQSRQSPNPVFLNNNKHQYNSLVNKYLKDENKKLFKYLSYELVQKYLNNYRKMWALLNLSIWIETKHGGLYG